MEGLKAVAKEQVTIRDAQVSDQAFIYSSFLKGLYYGNDWFKAIDKNTFMSKYKAVLESLLIKSTTKVVCLKDDPETVLGYAIYQPGVLHYTFIKPPFRRMGLAKSIIPVDVVYCSHLTKLGKAIKPKQWKFDPWRI